MSSERVSHAPERVVGAKCKKPGRLVRWRFAGLLAGLVLMSAGARADDYACTVLLCLANPAGPMAAPYCVPPIKKLFYDLAHFKPFPMCDLVSPTTGKHTYAAQVTSYYDACPAGTTALPDGQMAVLGTAKEGGSYLSDRPYYRGIGPGDDLAPVSDGEGGYSGLPAKTCVGTQVGTATLKVESGYGDGFSWTYYAVAIFEKVVVLDPVTSPRAIDVYVDDVLSRRVRY